MGESGCANHFDSRGDCVVDVAAGLRHGRGY